MDFDYSGITCIEAELRNGYFIICRGDDFLLDNENIPVLSYTEKGVWHIVSDPDPAAKGYFKLFLPKWYDPYKLKIKSYCSTVKIISVSATEVEIDNDNSDVSVSDMNVRNIYIKLRKGRVRAQLSPSLSTYINCGFGDADIKLSGKRDDYRIRSVRGIGTVMIDDKPVAREWSSSTESNNELVIKCGLGSVRIGFEGSYDE